MNRRNILSGLVKTLILLVLYNVLANPIGTVAAAQTNANLANKAYREAAENFHKLYEDTDFRNYESNWIKTIKQFHRIYLTYPETVRAAQSLYNIGKLYRSLFRWNGNKDYIDRSNKNFELLISDYRKSYLADDALYEIALNYRDFLNDVKTAETYFQQIPADYPDSEYVTTALNELGSHPSAAAEPLGKNRQGDDGEAVISSIEDTQSGQKIITKPTVNNSEKKRILQLDRWATRDWSRVVIVTDQPVLYKYNTLTEGAKPRFYVDVLNTVVSPGVSNKVVTNDGIIKQLRVAQFDPDTSRVVLDLDNYSNIKIFTFEFSDSFKIVLDVLSVNSKPGSAPPNLAGLENPPSSAQPDSIQPLPNIPTDTGLSLQKILGLKVDRIIIDPGHGGKDPGATNGKYREKDITLALALELRSLLEKKMENVEILLTRERDIYIPLEARTAFANKNKGDLFISLHVNSHSDSSARGIETYFLNLTDDKQSLQLAAVENKSSLKNVSDLQSILNDLMVSNKLKESHALGTELNSTLHSFVRKNSGAVFPNRGVKQAPFVVLLGANMPSVLVEIGFISNPSDLRNLLSKKYMATLAQGIYLGVDDYIKKYVQ